MKHDCKCVCKHKNVVYCKKCDKVHCQDCGEEWKAGSNYYWKPSPYPYRYNYYQPYFTDGTPDYQWKTTEVTWCDADGNSGTEIQQY